LNRLILAASRPVGNAAPSAIPPAGWEAAFQIRTWLTPVEALDDPSPWLAQALMARNNESNRR
jgi:hypothetical protein